MQPLQAALLTPTCTDVTWCCLLYSEIWHIGLPNEVFYGFIRTALKHEMHFINDDTWALWEKVDCRNGVNSLLSSTLLASQKVYKIFKSPINSTIFFCNWLELCIALAKTIWVYALHDSIALITLGTLRNEGKPENRYK